MRVRFELLLAFAVNIIASHDCHWSGGRRFPASSLGQTGSVYEIVAGYRYEPYGKKVIRPTQKDASCPSLRPYMGHMFTIIKCRMRINIKRSMEEKKAH